MSEIWKPVVGYEGIYVISDAGQIRNVKEGETLKQRAFNDYRCVSLSKDKKRKTYYVHCLVAEAFICERPEGKEVHHKNNVRSDNRADNLEWITHGENIKLSYENFPAKNRPNRSVGEKHGSAKLTEIQVKKIRRLYNTGKYTHKQLGRVFGVNDSTIGDIVNYKKWRHVR